MTRSANSSGHVTIGQVKSNPGQTIQATHLDINETVPYASVNITVLSVESATSIADDPNTQGHVVRVNVREQNATSNPAFYSFIDAARLVLPDGEIVAPTQTKDFSAPANGVTQLNWIDFSVSSPPQLDKLTLQLGKDNEVQETIPFNGHANLSMYQDKVATPNAQTPYAGMTWTVVQAVSSVDNDSTQAPKGMRYITLTLKINNPSSNQNEYIRVPSDYVRLQAGGETVSPISNTLEVTYPAGTVDKTGTATFLVPEGNNNFTLVLLAGTAGLARANQATINFQVP